MKKIISIAISGIMALSIVGCTKIGVSRDYPASIMVDKEIYLLTQAIHGKEVADSEIIGYTSSYTNEFPEKNGEINFSREPKLPYIKVGNDIAIFVDEQWYICESEYSRNNQGYEMILAKAKVVDISEKSILVIGEENLNGLTMVSIDNVPSNVEVGDIISFEFDGLVMESYPAQIGNVQNLTVDKKDGNLIGIYLEAFEELQNTDRELGANASELAIDLTEVSNLSEDEKSALVHLLMSKLDVYIYEITFEELEEQGKILDEDGFKSYPNGVLYEISSEAGEKNFMFNISKWVSSRGAYGFYENKVEFERGKYTWERGKGYIS